MANNNSYFYISGLISISFFFFFLSIIVVMSFVKTDVEVYALKKDKYMSVSMTTPKKQTSTNEKNVAEPETEESVEEPQDINVEDMFSNVWTKDVKKLIKKPKLNTKRFQDIGKKSKKIDKKNIKKVSKSINNKSAKKSDDAKKTSTGTAVNEYMAKIRGLVYQVFHPSTDMKGFVVVAVLEISAMGMVTDFRILTYSASQSLNSECDKIGKRLIGKLFPMNPDKKSSRITVNLIPENKGNI